LKRIARISALEAIAFALLLGGCASGGTNGGSQDVPQHLVTLMHESAEAWNRADLTGFLATYADDPGTAFMGTTVTLGLDSIRARYVRTYFRDGKPRDHLAFDELETRMLGPNHALMRGRCILTNPADNKKTYCRYTLIWEKRPEGWRIIHDHSS
jgi:beta-aspartyl-peptidase (threonine type)